jgi:integrase/recombinase XerD
MPATARMIDAYLVSLEARRAPYNTLRAYRSDLRGFGRAMPDELAAITLPQIEAYLSADLRTGATPTATPTATPGAVSVATSRRRQACLRSFYHWLIQQEHVVANPMDRLAMSKAPEREPRPLPEAQVAQVLSAIPPKQTRDRALFTLLYETGMRVSEALGIQVADLDLTPDDEKVRVFGKRQRERTVLLTAAPESIRLLRRHLKVTQITSGSIFRGDARYGGSNRPLDYSVAHYAWGKYCALSGVTGTIHQLRHSRATLLIKAGVPLATVRKLLGHRNIQSTLLYAEVDQETIKQDLLQYQRRRGKRG